MQEPKWGLDCLGQGFARRDLPGFASPLELANGGRALLCKRHCCQDGSASEEEKHADGNDDVDDSSFHGWSVWFCSAAVCCCLGAAGFYARRVARKNLRPNLLQCTIFIIPQARARVKPKTHPSARLRVLLRGKKEALVPGDLSYGKLLGLRQVCDNLG